MDVGDAGPFLHIHADCISKQYTVVSQRQSDATVETRSSSSDGSLMLRLASVYSRQGHAKLVPWISSGKV